MHEIHGGEKKPKYPHYPFATNRSQILLSHILNQNCQKKTIPKPKPKPKKVQVQYDDGSEHTQAFDNKVYRRSFPLASKKDPVSLLGEYRTKIKQHIRTTLDVKGSIKAQVHMECELKQTNSEGETLRNNPSFNREMRNVLHINGYDYFYDEATNKIMESMGKFCSKWIWMEF